MDNKTRYALNLFMQQMAKNNHVQSATEKFNVLPSVQQTLETKIQENSAFLGSINIVGVDELEGEKLGLGSSGPIAGRTNTDNNPRKTRDISTLDDKGYKLVKTNFDTEVKYDNLDMWAKISNFQDLIRQVAIKQQALDRIMIGFNGVKIEKDTNLTTYPLLQDVNIGWLQHMRNDAAVQVKDANNTIKADGTGDYKNIDALVYDVFETNIKQMYRNGVAFVAIMGDGMLQDKYFPLINNNDKATEMLAADMIISQKRIGGLQAVQVPFFPKNAILITPLDNLSIYYQNGKRRMMIKDAPEYDRIQTFESSNEGYVVEMYERATLIENITFA